MRFRTETDSISKKEVWISGPQNVYGEECFF